MDASEKINVFLNKISLRKRRFKWDNSVHYPPFEHELSKINISLSSSIQIQICEQLDVLKKSFGDYFGFDIFESRIMVTQFFN